MVFVSSYVFACVLVCFPIVESARILAVLSCPSLSHKFVFQPYILELLRRGHDVTVITADPSFPKGGSPPNLTEIDVHDVSYEMKRKILENTAVENEDIYNQIDIFWTMLPKMFYEQLKVDEATKLIKDKNQKFDLLILEFIMRSTISLRHIYNAPVIQISTIAATEDIYKVYGAATHSLLYPTYFHKRLYNLTWFEKIKEVYKHYLYENLVARKEVMEDMLMKEYFGPDIPTIAELHNNVDLLFLNVHPIWDNNRPVSPNVVYLGGMHILPQKELPKDLKTFVDSSKHGVIYMSFGTNIKSSSLPPQKIQMINKVFSKLPYDIVWKYDKDEFPGKSSNIKLVKWVPQSDLLRHPKLKLFITHGGLQSTDEAINAGVPLIGIPIVVDQWYNVEKYVHHGIGLKIELETLSEKQLLDGINEVINNKRYRYNIHQLRDIMNDQPQNSLERAIWWTEYVLRYGGAKHLRAPSANISWTDYFELYLVCFVFSVLILVLIVVSSIIYFIMIHFKRHFKVKTN